MYLTEFTFRMIGAFGNFSDAVDNQASKSQVPAVFDIPPSISARIWKNRDAAYDAYKIVDALHYFSFLRQNITPSRRS